MALLLIPIELLREVGAFLSVREVYSLVRVSRQLYTRLMETLYQLSHQHITLSRPVLTDGLQEITFWFDKQGNGLVMEWALEHESCIAG
jgi:hypothetical protein